MTYGQPYATCSACRQPFAITRGGNIYPHGPAGRCPGAGRLPLKDHRLGYPAVYGFRFDRDAEGSFYVKQRAENGEMLALPDVAQDRRRFGSWQEARAAGELWERDANDPRTYPVCNPVYRERRLDGVMAHLENDPRTGGTILVRDRACTAPPAEPCIVCGAPVLGTAGHDDGCMVAPKGGRS